MPYTLLYNIDKRAKSVILEPSANPSDPLISLYLGEITSESKVKTKIVCTFAANYKKTI
jgi:hypothetical protein